MTINDVKVGEYNYKVFNREGFTFYVRNDVYMGVDPINDTVKVITQMSDYVTESILTNDGATEEAFLVKTVNLDNLYK